MRRSLVFLLTLIFVFTIFSGPVSPKADAVVVSSIIVGTVIAAMAAAGIGLTVSGLTSSQLSGWVSDKLSSWATSLGGTVEDHINGNLITTTASGIIAVGTSAANSIAQFLGWLQTDEGLSDNSSETVISGGGQVLPISTTVPTLQEIIQNGYCAFVDGNRRRYFLAYDQEQNPVVVVYYSEGAGNILVAASKTNKPSVCSNAGDSFNSTPLTNYDSSLGVYYSEFTYPNQFSCLAPKYANRQECLQTLSNYLDGNTGSLSIDTGVITIPTIDTNTQDKWFLDVGADPGTTIDTVTDGVIAETIAGDLTVSGEVAEEEPEFVIDEPIAISGITEVFPFCIPFDIYALLSALSADPETPVFTARFVVPGVINEEFTIDLSPFNSVAQIVRTLELLAFIIGLALVTRERFLRS